MFTSGTWRTPECGVASLFKRVCLLQAIYGASPDLSDAIRTVNHKFNERIATSSEDPDDCGVPSYYEPQDYREEQALLEDLSDSGDEEDQPEVTRVFDNTLPQDSAGPQRKERGQRRVTGGVDPSQFSDPGYLRERQLRALLEKFLDHMAEFASPLPSNDDKVSSAIIGLADHTNNLLFEQDTSVSFVNLILTKRTPFSMNAMFTLHHLIAPLIRKIATVKYNGDSSDAAERELWAVMLQYAQPRYTRKFVPLFLHSHDMFHAWIKTGSPSRHHESSFQKLWHLSLRCKAFQRVTIGLSKIITDAEELRTDPFVEDYGKGARVYHYVDQCTRKVIVDVLWLGRLAESFHIIVQACKNFPKLRHLQIRCLDCPSPAPARAGLPYIDQLKNSLTLPYHEAALQTLELRYADLKSSSAMVVHPEMNLLFAMASDPLCYQYIGCSSKPCFLCGLVLGFSTFRSRQSHCVLDAEWALPKMNATLAEPVRMQLEGCVKLMHLMLERIIYLDEKVDVKRYQIPCNESWASEHDANCVNQISEKIANEEGINVKAADEEKITANVPPSKDLDAETKDAHGVNA